MASAASLVASALSAADCSIILDSIRIFYFLLNVKKAGWSASLPLQSLQPWDTQAVGDGIRIVEISMAY